MIKLHLGCGKRDFGDGWIHIDKADFPHIQSHDIVHLTDFKDSSVGLIYACHVLEYFDREECLEQVLPEWYRVLRVGGVLRVAVPDFNVMARLYTKPGGYKLESFLGPLYGRMKVGEEFIYHKTVFDFDSLSDLLKKVGFSRVKRYSWRNTEHSQFDDHSQAYLPHMDKEHGTIISLNLEAIK